MDQVSHKRAVEREILLFLSTDGGLDSVFYESSWLGLHLKSGGKLHFLLLALKGTLHQYVRDPRK